MKFIYPVETDFHVDLYTLHVSNLNFYKYLLTDFFYILERLPNKSSNPFSVKDKI